MCLSPTPPSFLLFFFFFGGWGWQYLLHYAQTCRRRIRKLFFLTDALISLIPFWLWPGREPENSKSVSSKLCVGVEKSIRCLSMPRISMGEKGEKDTLWRKEKPPISCYAAQCNQICFLFINNFCYFISGMSHNVLFELCWGGDLRLVDC